MNKNIDIKNGTDALWEYYYNLAKDYHEYYGNLEIPQSFKTTNGYEYDELGVSLGYWINIQKNIYNCKLNNRILKYRANLLKKIGMNFEKTRETEWLKNYNLAKIYYDHYGNSKISRNFKTRNGYEYDEQGVKLGSWINTQRQAYRGRGKINLKITEYQIKLLEEIEMEFGDTRGTRWLKNYNLAKIYYNHYGNVNIPVNFRTKNGYEYDGQGVRLGSWINTQKSAYNGKCTSRISKDQIELLEKLGMNFESSKDDKDVRWLKNYNLAKIYYDHYGNLKITSKFKTIDGYKYDESGVSLGLWLNNQRTAYNGKGTSRLTEEQIKLLEEIEINWFNENTDQKLQNEIIDKKNKIKKQIEILNRVRSYLNTLDENKVYSKEEINSGFVKKLSK